MVTVPPISVRWPFLVYPELFIGNHPQLPFYATQGMSNSLAGEGASAQATSSETSPTGEETVDTSAEGESASDSEAATEPDVRLLPENRWLVTRPTISQCYRGEVELPEWIANCRVAQKYINLLGPLDWDNWEEPDRGPQPGVVPDPMRAFAAVFLVKLNEEKEYMPGVRDYLLDHPSLIWLFGFRLEPAADSIYGFDVEGSLPTSRHMSRVLRNCDNQAYQFLLDSTVQLIGDALPEGVEFGQQVSGDTKHIIAWVKENNHKDYVPDRYDPERQPKGDPDCKLGVKKRRNRSPEDKLVKAEANNGAQTPKKEGIPASQKTEDVTYYWGYASGVLATIIPADWGEVVLAEYTQTFNESDVSYFYPLMNTAEGRLGFRPSHGAFDKAYDAHYVYNHFDEVGGFAAVPYRASGGHPKREFDEAGLPLCAAGLAMPLKSSFFARSGLLVPHQKGRYVCPLLYPTQTAKSCPINHDKWSEGGCMTTMATNNGARVRYELDRESPEFKRVYNQRSATERINSRAKELGIERPKLRNQKSITNINTLIYVLMNLRSYHKIEKRKAGIFE